MRSGWWPLRINPDLVEAVALGRLLHENGSDPLIRALNARLARLCLAEIHRVGTGSAQMGRAISDAMERLPGSLESEG